MNDYQHGHRRHHADDMPAELAIFEAVEHDDVEGVLPNPLRQREGDPMVDDVQSRFFGIPFELHETRCRSIVCTELSSFGQGCRDKSNVRLFCALQHIDSPYPNDHTDHAEEFAVGDDGGAEGATAPETLRLKNRNLCLNSEKWGCRPRRWCKPTARSRATAMLSGQ